MLRALKITMSVFGAILAIEGILDIALPEQRALGMGLEQKFAQHAQMPMTILGATWLAIGAWIIVGARDPLRHINWVKFVLTFPLVLLLVLVSSALRGHVSFQQILVDLVFDALFFVLFLAFYHRVIPSHVTRGARTPARTGGC
ncbi:MAG TPA: hypothetical protein VFN67_32895 [Polyangiales bacterium]|nr:hypothetical protein [Polyangiales bacterium]